MEKAQRELEDALGAMGLVYRPESQMNQAYVQGTSKMTLAYVVNKGCVLRYLHEFTDYVKFISELYMNNTDGLRRDEMIALAKKKAFAAAPIPKVWPWLIDQTQEDEDTPTTEVKPEDGFTLVAKKERRSNKNTPPVTPKGGASPRNSVG